MANKYLARDDAPFGDKMWNLIDTAMTEAAKRLLVGRRLLHVDGPFGLGLKSVPLQDEKTESGLIAGRSLPVLLIEQPFTLGARDLANYESQQVAFDPSPVVQAARECARLEDDLIFNGAAGVPGLLTAAGVNKLDLSAWDEAGAAAADVIRALTVLDEAGFHGPYSLALAPERYNRLFRLYSRGNKTELEHLQAIVTDGVHKAPNLESGGLLLASARQYASIVLGQDMSVGFIGPAGSEVEFFISESLVPRILRPQAICVLNE